MPRFGAVIKFFALLVATLFCIDRAVNIGFRKINTSNIGSVNAFMNGRCDAEVLICGSSRALVHYDPAVFQNIIGLSTYNIGRNGGHIDVQLFTLKAYLARNPRPKFIILNLDFHSLVPSEQLLMSDILPFVPYLGDPSIYDGLKEINPEVWKWRVFPLYPYVIEDMNFRWFDGLLGSLKINPKETYYHGFDGRDRSWSNEFDQFARRNPNGIQARVEPRGEAYFRSILDVAQDQKIPILLVYSPEFIGLQHLIKNRNQILMIMKKIASEYAVPVWDFSDSEICTDKSFFYNSEHLNRTGARFFSTLLSHRLEKAGGELIAPRPR